MKNKLNHVYLALGSNVGDRQKFVRLAIEKLGGLINDVEQAPLLETEPWGVTDQPKFLNTS